MTEYFFEKPFGWGVPFHEEILPASAPSRQGISFFFSEKKIFKWGYPTLSVPMVAAWSHNALPLRVREVHEIDISASLSFLSDFQLYGVGEVIIRIFADHWRINTSYYFIPDISYMLKVNWKK